MSLSGRVSLKFVALRLLWGVPVLLAVIVTSFFVLRAAPGGPFDREKPLPPRILKNLRAQYDLDRPVVPVWTPAQEGTPRAEELARFAQEYPVTTVGPVAFTTSLSGAAETQLPAYVLQVASGDLGVSMKYTDETVNDIVWRTLPVSATLGLAAFALAYAIGIALGLLAATRRGTWVDAASVVVATVGLSAPNFVLGALLILVFSLTLGWLPPALWEGPAYAVLPTITLAAGPSAYIARLTRSGALEALSEGYIRTARAKGLTERAVVWRHAFVNALGPLITVSGPLLATLVTGSFIVEHVFALPGMGRYFITAVIDRDYPMVLGVTVVYAALIVIANIAVDVLYALADPRVEDAR